ncbi:MAG: hypothetical protein CM15mP95_3390 [Alphaproteobacteria bacterium]|nr:MAG: hypothetical protein CM15mP95_3390 [Alphaproteobacteria bacterium]
MIRKRFREITRWGDLDNVLQGLEAAKKAGLAIKLNAVALKGVNEFDLADMVAWAGAQGFDMTIIEVMPMGDIGNENRVDQYLPLSQVRADLSKRFTLIDSRLSNPRASPLCHGCRNWQTAWFHYAPDA